MLDARAMTQFRIPHEAEPVSRIFTCWPANSEEWPGGLAAPRREFALWIKAILDGTNPSRFGVTVLARNADAEASARQALGPRVRVLRATNGDVWARDTGPILAVTSRGERLAIRFGFNGWGGKYLMPGDLEVAPRIARETDAELVEHRLITEGGALEFDGEGTVLTTRICLINGNRNPGLSEAQITRELKSSLGLDTVLWLDDGLKHDHTDGHIDNAARFVRPGQVVCMKPYGDDDPQAERLIQIRRQLSRMTDALGRRLDVRTIPSPGRVTGANGDIWPASYLNWIIGPKRVVVPVYGQPGERRALTAIQALFPDRRVVGSPARAILEGGGAFHCVTCQVPGESVCSERIL